LREEVWLPFEQARESARDLWLSRLRSGEGHGARRWLADLHIDRPLLVGEALEARLFNSLEAKQLAASWRR
jgi:hypothetical protein